ncbi:hypothetical protein BGW42_000073 [Actinomortierella wolfii]|nr:hypothetical protein BGW42_000073 [Actinomortierella wolfii]
MLGQQQHARRSLENLNTGSSSSLPLRNSPAMSSSFSTFRDIEVPLGGNTELNDDAKEKSLRRRSLLDERAARRRSLLSSPNASRTSDAHGSGHSNLDDENRRRSSGLQRSSTIGASSSGLAGAAASGGAAAGGSTVLGIVEPNQGPLPALLKVSADSFEQWLKLATDNKINANNSWNFALIDYFHEMSLLRDGDSINFQKASCTLDGCVKIYTSRVDSVATETTKLLGGLATSTKRDDADGGDNEDNDESDKPTRKKAVRRDNTLAKDFDSLSLEKFNLEFSVDPLFKKTSADFDEGGARGLLLNHLSVDPEGKIIFDAGDARDDGDDDDDSEEEEEEEEEEHGEDQDQQSQERKRSRKKTDVESALLDIQRLRSKFLPALNTIFERDICPSLKDFPLSGTSEMDLSFLKRFHDDGDDYMDENRNTGDADNTRAERNDFDDDGDDDVADYGDVGYSFPDDEDDHAGNDDQMMDPSAANDGEKEVVDAFGDLDAQIAARHAAPAPLATAATAAADDENLLGGAGGVDADQLDLYAHFDSALLRNWAGPEHWKLRRIPKMKPTDAPVTDADGNVIEGTDGKKKGSSRAPLVLDFMNSEEVDEDELFAPADPASLVFTNAAEAEHRRSDYLLPDDVHFSSKQLLRMFLKPTFIVKSSKKPQRGYLGSGSMLSAGGMGVGGQDGDENLGNMAYPDEQFWATHSNNVRNDSDINQLTEQLDNTQIYNDYIEEDDDEFQFFGGAAGDTAVLEAAVGSSSIKSNNDAALMSAGSNNGGVDNTTTRGLFMGLLEGGDGNDYASQLVSQPKRVKANFISFSKTAKKVDVKRLKDNIWKQMSSQALKRQARSDASDLEERRRKAKLSRMDGVEGEDGAQQGEAVQDGQEADKEEDEEEEYVKKEQKFTEIIGGLHKVYPEHKLKDISVPFCFICLLHLANEKNLSITGTENLNELIIKQEGETF